MNKDGYCDIGFSIAKRGTACESHEECLDSLGRPFFCRCTYNGNTNRVCDTGPEDEEWKLARDYFIKYLRVTMECHTAHRLGECMRSDLYKMYKCAEFKALNFAKLNDMPECLKEINGGNSEFAQFYKYCVEGNDGESLKDVPMVPSTSSEYSTISKLLIISILLSFYLLN